MMARRGVLGVLAGGVSMMLSGCASSRSLRYKMTVELDTPEGVRSGFAVREVRYEGGGSWFPFGESRPRTRLRGEAIAVDLPDGNVLFALLSSGRGDIDYAKLLPSRVKLTGSSSAVELWPRAPDMVGLKHTDPLPMLVRFRDNSDPTSVERVDLADLTATFGPGYALRRITVEVIDQPVTTGIERRLEWLVDPNRKRFDPNKKPQGIPLGNYRGLFSADIAQ